MCDRAIGHASMSCRGVGQLERARKITSVQLPLRQEPACMRWRALQMQKHVLLVDQLRNLIIDSPKCPRWSCSRSCACSWVWRWPRRRRRWVSIRSCMLEADHPRCCAHGCSGSVGGSHCSALCAAAPQLAPRHAVPAELAHGQPGPVDRWCMLWTAWGPVAGRRPLVWDSWRVDPHAEQRGSSQRRLHPRLGPPPRCRM